MKNLITLSALAFSLCFLFSCTKDSKSLNTSSGGYQNGSGSGSQSGPRMSPNPAPHPDFVGDWVSVRMQPVTNGTYNGLHGNYPFNNPLSNDYNFDMKIVFLRTSVESTDVSPSPDATPVMTYNYRALPTDMMSSTGKVHFAFYMTASSLDLGIASVNPAITPNPADFTNIEYRYFFITRATYLNNSIDWTDYNAVTTLLNTTP